MDAIPGLGTFKEIQEVFTGVDLITGQQLSVADRIATGGGTILSIGIPGGKIFGKIAIKKTIDGGAWLISKFRKTEIPATEKQGYRLNLDLQLFAEKTNSSTQIPRTGTEWNDYYKSKYGNKISHG